MTTTADLGDLDDRTRELVNQACVGNEVLLTRGGKPVARIVSVSQKASYEKSSLDGDLKFPTFHLGGKGQLPSKSELAEEMLNH